MTEEEAAFIDWARRMIHADRIPDMTAPLRERVTHALERGTSRDFIGVCFDLACRAVLAEGDGSEAARAEVARLCGISSAKHGTQPWTALYEACLLHLGGAHDAAVPGYRAAGREAEILWPGSNGCKTVFSLAAAQRLLSEKPIARGGGGLFRGWPRRKRADPVVVVAADGHYFSRFGEIFLKSVNEHGAARSVHLHLINPRPADLDLIIRRQAEGIWPEIAVTTENYAGPEARTYFALSRFLLAPALLERYERPLLISDIDATYRSRIDLTALPDHWDVGLRMKHRGFRSHPWQTVQAGLVLYAPTGFGRRFAGMVAALARWLFEARDGADIWFADQNVLYHTLLLSHAEGWGDRIIDLTQRGMPGDIQFVRTIEPAV